MNRCFLTIFGLFLALLVGCGDKNVATVSGKVSYAGGSVPAGTRVFFELPGQGYIATAIVEDNGSFKLNYLGNPEVLPGDYKIFVGPPPSNMSVAEFEALKKKVAAEFRKKGKKPPASPDWVLPGKYYEVSTSPLKQTIEPGANDNVQLLLED